MRAKGNAPAKVQVSTWRRDWPWMMMGLLGGHQAVNAAVAVGCVEILREQGVTLNDESVTRGLADVRWPARMETLRQRPIIVLDCATIWHRSKHCWKRFASRFPGPLARWYSAARAIKT